MPTGHHKPPSKSEIEGCWVRGRAAEILVAELYVAQGHWVFPAYAARPGGQAPMFRGPSPWPTVITPDLLVTCSADGPFWAEVKAYLEPARFKGELRHGVNKRQWDNYSVLHRLTTLPSRLVVVELASGEVLELDACGTLPLDCSCRHCQRLGTTMPSCEVYFRREWFSQIGKFREEDWTRVTAQAEKEVDHG